MESLGYRIQTSGIEEEDIGRRAYFDADSIIVNRTIVDIGLSESDVQCYFLQFFTSKQKRDISTAESLPKRVLLTVFYAVKSTVGLVGVVWSLLFSRSPLYSKTDFTPFLQPREPEELWLRWATVLVSCAFPDWLTDVRKTCSSGTGNSEDRVSRISG